VWHGHVHQNLSPINGISVLNTTNRNVCTDGKQLNYTEGQSPCHPWMTMKNKMPEIAQNYDSRKSYCREWTVMLATTSPLTFTHTGGLNWHLILPKLITKEIEHSDGSDYKDIFFWEYIINAFQNRSDNVNEGCVCIYIYIQGCPRRNVPDFGRVFLMLKYTDITQNTYVQSW